MREGESEGGRREGRRKEGIATAHRQSTNVRYNELHGSKPHFWAETDAGSFVAQEQIHGKVPVVSPSPSLHTRVAGCCLVSRSLGTSIHLCSLLLVSSPRESDFLHQLGSALEG